MSESIANFRLVHRGYHPAQVDHHMNELAQAAASVWQEATERTRQINELEARNGQLKNDVESHAQRTRTLEKALREAGEPTYAGLGEHITSILTLVDNEAYELRTRAQADAANRQALAEENALRTRQDADEYARRTSSAADDEVTQILQDARAQADRLREEAMLQSESLLDEAKRHADSLQDDADRRARARQDADRQAMARREQAEAAYEQARANAAAAAVDFETTLAARRETSAIEFAVQVMEAEQQLAGVRLRAEQARNDSERAQQEAASKIAQQLEQATARAQSLVVEAKTKAERIRDNSERDLAAATQRRDSITAQLNKVRQDLAALGDVSRFNPRLAEPAADQNGAGAGAEAEQEEAEQEEAEQEEAEQEEAEQEEVADAQVDSQVEHEAVAERQTIS